jgi:hypothetical protein
VLIKRFQTHVLVLVIGGNGASICALVLALPSAPPFCAKDMRTENDKAETPPRFCSCVAIGGGCTLGNTTSSSFLAATATSRSTTALRARASIHVSPLAAKRAKCCSLGLEEHAIGGIRGVVGDNVRTDPPHVSDRMLDFGGREPAAATACRVATAAASARATACSSSLAPLDGYAALAASRQALEASVVTSRSARRPAD